MPVPIGPYEAWSEEEFEELARIRPPNLQSTDPAMLQLLLALDAGAPIRISLANGQNPRSLRSAIVNAARHRGLRLKSLTGDGFIAVKKVGTYANPKGSLYDHDDPAQ